MAETQSLEGQNITEVKAKALSTFNSVKQLREERKQVNERIGALRQDLQAMGIPKPAFDMALRYALWDPDKREGFDVAYDIVREAIGLPVKSQAEMFDRTGEVVELKREDDPTPDDLDAA